MKIVVNGAGIAGTALAYWLRRIGHEVLLVERAPALRTGGHVLNLWGVGYDAAERMGLLPRFGELEYTADELRMVDRHGRTRGGYPSQVLRDLTRGRIATLARGDVATAIHALLDDEVETIFGDSIATIEDDGARVRVGFERSAPREADLVVGADGLHSHVRRIAFGPDARFERTMGCHVAAFEVAGYRPRDDRLYVAHSAPGRYIARFPVRGDRMLFFMLCRDEYLEGATGAGTQQRKAALAQAFSGMGWETPAILSALMDTEDLYFDSISQIRMDRWTKGRVALLGDAAACPSLIAGEGAGFALAEACVLAGEIGARPNDIDQALASYEARIKPFVSRKQKSAERLVPSFVPATALGVRVRDFSTLLMRLPVFPRLLMGRYLSDDMALPAYPIPER
jgi:2-polyprenyl-6-methoxyphenol hydroxylase-like FAD-dependent oxidoreductase